MKRSLKDELAWRIFVEQEGSKERKLILIRMSFDRWHLPDQFSQAAFRSGDILEYVVHGELKWAIWNREEILFWQNGIIEKRPHRTFPHSCRKLPIIIPPNEDGLSPTDIYINATNENSGLDFSNRLLRNKWDFLVNDSFSQAWAAWCVTKNSNFSAISSQQNYYLGTNLISFLKANT